MQGRGGMSRGGHFVLKRTGERGAGLGGGMQGVANGGEGGFLFGQGLLSHMLLLALGMPGEVLYVNQHGVLLHVQFIPNQ